MTRLLIALAAGALSACTCFSPVSEPNDGGPQSDAGDAGAACAYPFNIPAGVRYSPATAPAHAWVSEAHRDGCVVYWFSLTVGMRFVDPAAWTGFVGAHICNACDEPIALATTHYGSLDDLPNRYYDSPFESVEPSLNYAGVDLGFGLRDEASTTVPSHCVSSEDLWCGVHGWPGGPDSDAGSPAFNVRTTELGPGMTLSLGGYTLEGLRAADAQPSGDPVAPVMPFEDWRGTLFGTSRPRTQLNLDGGRLDLLGFLPRAVPLSQLAALRASKPRDQACARYGFPLIRSWCRDRLDPSQYGPQDLVEIVIPNVQLPSEILTELRRRSEL